MTSRTKFANKPAGNDEYQQVIAEVAKLHQERLPQAENIEARNESANKPEGNYEYEQMIAENTVFTAKEKIEEAAYFIAQQRGFAPGLEVSDWHQAETEFEAMQCGA